MRHFIAEFNGKKFIGKSESNVLKQVTDYLHSLTEEEKLAARNSKMKLYKEGDDPNAPIYAHIY
jgi:hypothetical protein